jgi:cellulose synthase/poly-beta-1,6-N-acetylglucosamine synthase-like glycosyltransferase
VFAFATVSQLSEPSQMMGTWRMSYFTLPVAVKKEFITVLDGKCSKVRPSGLATLNT